MIKILKLCLITIIVVGIIRAVFLVIKGFSNPGYVPVASLILPKGYDNLFVDSVKRNIVLQESYFIRGHNPIAVFSYNNIYSILVCTYNVPKVLDLNDLVQLRSTRMTEDLKTPNSGINFSKMIFAYTWDSLPTLNELLITLFGDSLWAFNNNTIKYYSMNIREGFLQFRIGKAPDIEFYTNIAPTEEIPAEIVFVKKGGNLFFVLIDNIFELRKIDKDLPLKIFDYEQRG
jgi:hypothetical protein